MNEWTALLPLLSALAAHPVRSRASAPRNERGNPRFEADDRSGRLFATRMRQGKRPQRAGSGLWHTLAKGPARVPKVRGSRCKDLERFFKVIFVPVVACWTRRRCLSPKPACRATFSPRTKPLSVRRQVASGHRSDGGRPLVGSPEVNGARSASAGASVLD